MQQNTAETLYCHFTYTVSFSHFGRSLFSPQVCHNGRLKFNLPGKLDFLVFSQSRIPQGLPQQTHEQKNAKLCQPPYTLFEKRDNAWIKYGTIDFLHNFKNFGEGLA